MVSSSNLTFPVGVGLVIASSLSALMIFFFFSHTKTTDFPVVDQYPGGKRLNEKELQSEFITNASHLIEAGISKYSGPFKMRTNLGDQIILPPSYMTWLKDNNDMDHQAQVANDFFAYYPGLEGLKVVVDPHKTLIGVVKAKLSQNMQIIQCIQEHMAEILQVEWTHNTANLFNAVRVLRSWSKLARPFIHWFVPECRKCRSQVRSARRMIGDYITSRDGKPPTATCLEWMHKADPKRQFHPADSQLALSISAIHTSSELLKQVLLDICMNPQFVQPLRDEIATALVEKGWTTAGFYQMELLDSVIKETQRLKPGSLVNLNRQALKDIKLPNGFILPKGSSVAIPSSTMWSPVVYENPTVFDGYRFLNMRHANMDKSNSAQIVSTSTEHFAFGMGKALCPGRFFVANEIKAALAHILTKYDVRLEPGTKPKVMMYGYEMMTDPKTKVQVRRRKEETDML